MYADLDFLYHKYDEFNRAIFSSALPRIRLKIGRGAHTLGCLHRGAGRNMRDLGSWFISISSRYDFPQAMLEDILIHEMIHLKIALSGVADTSAHGPRFKSLMKEINERHGRNISVSIRLPEQVRASDSRPAKSYILTCRIDERDMFMRCASTRIFEAYRQMVSHPRISDIQIFFSISPELKRYKNVRTLKFYEMTEEVRNILAMSPELIIRNGILSLKD